MNTAANVERDLEVAVGMMLGRLKQFVANLHCARLGDRHWRDSVQRSCNELCDILGTLRERLARHKLATPKKVGELRGKLQRIAREITGQCNLQRIQEIRATLARDHDELLNEIRALRIAPESNRGALRALRMPRMGRTLFHTTSGLICCLLYQFVLNRSQSIIILSGIMALITVIESSRRLSPRWNDFLMQKVFHNMVRPREHTRIASASFYMAAITLSVLIAPQVLVCAAVLLLAFADPAASAVGIRWGKKRLSNDKSYVGSLAFLVTGIAVTWIYLSLAAAPRMSAGAILGLAVTMSLTAAAVELFCDRIDDNFAIPISATLVGLLWF